MTRYRPYSGARVGFGLAGLLGLQMALACKPSVGVPEGNLVPVAEARVQGQLGQNVTIDFTGAPVSVVLDGSFSKDPEGPIKTYRWLSGRRAPGTGGPAAAGGAAAGSGAGAAGMAADSDDGGVAPPPPGSPQRQRWVPAGAPADWPEDIEKPVVSLDEGEYTFVLWVLDQQNVVSEPSTLTVTVRTPLNPAVEACVATVFNSVPAGCKACVCSVDDECRALSNQSVCNGDCWGLVSCIGSRCQGLAASEVTGCALGNCSPYLGGATGAMMVGRCVMACAEQCRM